MPVPVIAPAGGVHRRCLLCGTAWPRSGGLQCPRCGAASGRGVAWLPAVRQQQAAPFHRQPALRQVMLERSVSGSAAGTGAATLAGAALAWCGAVGLHLPVLAIAASLGADLPPLIGAAAAASALLALAGGLWWAMARGAGTRPCVERRVRLDLDLALLVCEERSRADHGWRIRQSCLPLDRLACLCSHDAAAAVAGLRVELCLPVWTAGQDRPQGYPLWLAPSAAPGDVRAEATARQLAAYLGMPLFDDTAACNAWLAGALPANAAALGGADHAAQ